MHVFICEDSPNGILTGIYDAWSARIALGVPHSDVRLVCAPPDNYELFCEYHAIAVSEEKAKKVADTLRKKFGAEFCHTILNAVFSGESDAGKTDKADAVYHTVAAAFRSQNGGSAALSRLGDPYVYRVFELSRATASEAHHLEGFLRFSELENGVLFSEIHPKNYALPILAEHFTDRFPAENFIIYDRTHETAAVHRAKRRFFLADAPKLSAETLPRRSGNEEAFRSLWLTFFKSIAIEARTNPKLQKQNIPMRFWNDTPELRRNDDGV